jgi:GrpB-like predicted nucleotidyltransferase (UPF0157 family)
VVDEPVDLAEYAPEWPVRFAEQRERVTAVLAPWLAAPVEHIGSTSVTGLPAKPVIDMLARCGPWLRRKRQCRRWKRKAGCSGRMTRPGTTACGSCARTQRPAPITCT